MEAGELKGFLGNPVRPDLSKLDGRGACFGKAFVDAAKGPAKVPDYVKADYEAEMLLFFEALQGHGAEFGYRVAHEAARFIHFYKLLGDGKIWNPDADDGNGGKGAWADKDASGRDWFKHAMDCVVFQKFLPKLHGSRVKLGPLLKKLWFLCVKDADGRGSEPLKAASEVAHSTEKEAEPAAEAPPGAPYPLSAEKIARMWLLLNQNGFASFAEA